MLGFIRQLANGATWFQAREYRFIPPASIGQVRQLLGPSLADVSAESIGSYGARLDDVDSMLRQASAKFVSCVVRTNSQTGQ